MSSFETPYGEKAGKPSEPAPSLSRRASGWMSRLQETGARKSNEPGPEESVSVDERLGAFIGADEPASDEGDTGASDTPPGAPDGR